MKKFVTLMLLMSVFLAIVPGIGSAAAAPIPKLYLNGSKIDAKASPRIVNSFTLVPIRVVAEGLGYDVTWEKNSRTVTVFNGVSEIQFVINQTTALVNGSQISLDAPAMVDNGVTFIPIRFVGENFGLDVVWDQPTRSVHLYEQVSADPAPPADPAAPGEPADPQQPPVNGDPVLPPIPADATSIVTAVEFDGTARIAIKHTGAATPNQPFWSGTKLVLDIPYAAFEPAVQAEIDAMPQAQGELVIGTPLLQKVRYAKFSDKPTTVRVVLDLAGQVPYTMTQNENEIDIDFDLTAVPQQPAAPADGDLLTPDGQKIFKVVLDAGHGAHDPGAKSVTGKREKDFNLAVTLKIQKLLENEPRIKTYLTRSDDTFVELNDRASFANKLGADVFVSIHGNSWTPSTSGTETYYNRSNSKELAAIIHRRVVSSLGLPDRKVRTAGFVVIKKTTMPAILLESGYLSNTGDEKVLYSEEGQNKIAAAVAAGIKEFLKVQ